MARSPTLTNRIGITADPAMRIVRTSGGRRDLDRQGRLSKRCSAPSTSFFSTRSIRVLLKRTFSVVEEMLLYFDGCPNLRKDEQRLRQALEQLGLPDSALVLHRVETVEHVERLAFRSSP
jgi:hypothetical protein